MKNPWLGLSSYTEESLNEYQFNGRSEAIVLLSSLISRNLFVTLYGRSGIGKTSLLQAGVYPVLRKKGMFPVTIRLNDVSDTGLPASEKLWDLLIKDLEDKGCRYVPCDKNDPCKPDFSKTLVLRELFSAGRFIDSHKQEIIPVLVLDQFEEVLYHAPLASKLLLKQFYALIDDNYDTTIGHPSWHEETNFRIVVSIREDDLYLFEDFIDTLNCPDLKENRYRLLPLSDEEAKEVILNPAKDVFEEGLENEIAEKIISLLHENGKSMNTLMLSLICHVLFEQAAKRNRKIMLSDLDSYKDIIETYYLEATKNLPKSQLYYLEDKLIDDQGRRKFIYTKDLENHAPLAKQYINGSNSSILIENQGRIEFIHDQLAAAVFKIKSTRKSKRTKQIGIAALILSLLAILLISLSIPTSPFKEYENSRYIVWLQNNTKVLTFTIDSLDEFPSTYSIDDCPNLKTINIEKSDIELYVNNCPNLIEILYPEDFSGKIIIRNCWAFDNKSDSLSFIDIRNSEIYDSEEYTMSSTKPRTFNVCSYDSINNKFYYYRDPYELNIIIYDKKKHISEWKFRTELSDSLKRITDCFVPFGTKESFLKLRQFQPFHSINELPIYDRWYNTLRTSLLLIDLNPWAKILSIAGIILVQCLFWYFAYNLYRNKYKSRIKRIAISLVYGIGISLLAVLAFLAIYWLCYKLIPSNSETLKVWISSVFGVLSAIICICTVYKNAFYTFKVYFAENGYNSLLKDCGIAIKKAVKNIRKNIKIYFVFLLGIFAFLAIVYYYVDGKKRRYNYLNELKQYDYAAKLPMIIDELEKQHGSPIYGFFTDSLNEFRNRIDGTLLVVDCNSRFIEKLAKEQGIDSVGFSNILVDAISEDGNDLCLLSIRKDKGYQYLYLNLAKELLDTISCTSEYFIGSSAFSPSSKFILTSRDNNLYSYNINTRSLRKVDNGFNGPIDDIVMSDDSTYYFISNKNLYRGYTSSNQSPELIDSSEVWNRNLIFHSPNLVAANNSGDGLIIYDIAKNHIIFNSPTEIGTLIDVNDSNAITRNGLLDLEKDSVIIEKSNYHRYALFDKMIDAYADEKNSEFVFVYQNEDTINSIPAYGYPGLLRSFLSKDGSIFINLEKVYRFSNHIDIDIPGISEYDRRLFDLK